jgi:mannonate dehydratase
MDRRDFGKGIMAGVAAAGVVGAQGAEAVAAAPRPVYNNLIPNLKVIRNDKVRLGAQGTGGGETTISQENINYQKRWGIKYITASVEGPRGVPGVLPNEAAADAAARAAGGGAATGRAANLPGAGGRMSPTEPWNLDGLKQIRDVLAENDLVLEGLRMDSAYIAMKAGLERERYLQLICDNVRKAGMAGVKLISTHWNLSPIRRNFTVPGRGNSTYVGFKLEPDWKSLPPLPAAPVSSDEYWERLDTFMKAVIPVCKESNVNFATHPYDPGGLPIGYLGVADWDDGDFIKAMLRYEQLYDDPHNGFQYDTGVARESLPAGNTQIALLHGLLQRKKIHQIHFRNVRGGLLNFIEVYHDEGDVNLFNIIRLLRDMNWEGSLLPDHSVQNPGDRTGLQSFAFSNGYIKGLLRAADEEAIRATSA